VTGDLVAQERLDRIGAWQGDEVVAQRPDISQLLSGRLAKDDGLDRVGATTAILSSDPKSLRLWNLSSLIINQISMSLRALRSRQSMPES